MSRLSDLGKRMAEAVIEDGTADQYTEVVKKFQSVEGVEPVLDHQNGGQRYEYSEHLWITTGVCGRGQESSFMNATLQDTGGGGLEFSVGTHVGVPGFILTEDELHRYLLSVFRHAIEATDKAFGQGTLNVVIQLGPAGDDEED